MPLISVIMPAYNEEKYIAEAINSILTQTFSDFELLIIDDGSKDDTVKIVNTIDDTRVRLISLHENKGNRYAANIGLKEAKGKYIVRQDADDISYDYRLQKQFDFMESNPDVGLSGGGLKIFGDAEGEQYFPTSEDEINVSFLFGNVVSQPTSIMRKDVITKYNFNAIKLVFQTIYPYF